MSDYREYLDARFEGGPLDGQVRPVPGFDMYTHRQLVARASDGVLVGFVFAYTGPR